ncbi:NAD(P)/FAD-dependent oxidoreductase [Zemynaea arenosa]|nr:FAD-dependent oxidoreductase [Massilia arenosa]
MKDIVIIGGGYAGLSCALRLGARVRKQGLAARVHLVSARPVVVERIRLHQRVAGQAMRERALDTLLAGTGVRLVRGAAEDIDVQAHTVRVDGEVLNWDRLVLAAGSRTDLQAVPGAAAHAVSIEPDTAVALMQRVAALPPGSRVAIVGGGLTGIETASEIAESCRGLQLDVRLVAGQRLAADFPPPARAHLRHTLERLGVQVIEGQRVVEVAADHLCTHAAPLPFDLCIWTAGFAAPPLARHAGLSCNAAGQVLVDPMLRALSHPAVYVAGDMGAPVQPPGQPLPQGCKSAMPMGVHVAENIVRELRGAAPDPFDFALMFYCVSLGRRDGLIQWADAAGALTGRTLTGRRAAWFKEFICKSTIWALQLERRGLPAVVWKRTGQPALPSQMHKELEPTER